MEIGPYSTKVRGNLPWNERENNNGGGENWKKRPHPSKREAYALTICARRSRQREIRRGKVGVLVQIKVSDGSC